MTQVRVLNGLCLPLKVGSALVKCCGIIVSHNNVGMPSPSSSLPAISVQGWKIAKKPMHKTSPNDLEVTLVFFSALESSSCTLRRDKTEQ
jgi:hypothetical protein